MSKLTNAIRSMRARERVQRRPPEVIDSAASASMVSEEHGRSAALRRVLAGFRPPYCLHMACGPIHLDGWINLDADASHSTVDAVWDLREALPLPSASVRFIFHEHFFEHLTVPEGLALLKESHRLLMPGGVLRVSMPDLAECVRQYYENDWRQPWMKKYGYEFIQTRAEMINIAFRHWDHKWLYDREELHRRLREAGFESLRDCKLKESDVPELCGLECRDETRLIVEAIR